MRATQHFSSLVVFLVAFGLVMVSRSAAADGLRRNFYWRTCPQAGEIVRRITWQNVASNPGLAAKFLRIHYHDCFVRGCDASILLDPVGNSQSEKQARPNLSLSGFEIYDQIKDQIERVCPGVVSCADIVALAARDAVSFQFRFPLWEVPTGRRDGVVSTAADIPGNLPSPFDNFTTLTQIFSNKGFDVRDLVALSGAHTIGVAHCGTFARRLNFTGAGDTDPALDSDYAGFLRQQCPTPINPATTVEMDPRSSIAFDTRYFATVLQRRGLFQSDAALLTDRVSADIVRQLQRPRSFFQQFAVSMRKMGAVGVLTGAQGEIRRTCRAVNA